MTDAIQLAAALAARYFAPPETDFYFAYTDGKPCEPVRTEHLQSIEIPEGVAAAGARIGLPF